MNTSALRIVALTGIIALFSISFTFAQQGMGVGTNNPLEMLHVTGAIKVGTDINNSSAAPSGGAGTIRFKAGQFEGWDGTAWTPLGGGADTDWTVSGNNQYSAVSGNVGIGTASPAQKLHVAGSIQMVDGNQQAGYIPVSDANGKMTWTDPTGIAGPADELVDADGDTKVEVERNPDEDIIRFRSMGTEYFTMNKGRLAFVNTGNSVFIGDEAGAVDDLTNNFNVFVGTRSGQSNISGDSNTAVGAYSMRNNTTGYFNTGIGTEALSANTIGTGNTMLGYAAGQKNSGTYNTGVGFKALRLQQGGGKNVALGTEAGQGNVFHSKTGSVYIGHQAGWLNQGSYNVIIGHSAAHDWITESNRLVIQNSATNANGALVYGEFDNGILATWGKFGVGTTAPSDKLHVIGNIRMVDGNQQAGYIPVSDANGKMTWTDPTIITTAADGDGSSTNELQTLSQSGTNVTLSNGGGTISVADNDNSSSNEIQTLSLSGNTLAISSGNNVSLAGYVNTDNQNLSSTTSGTNRTINISGGTGTTISVADNDNSSSNEIQTLSLSGNTLAISSGNNVSLAGYVNTDNQNLSSTTSGTNRTINISGGTGTTISVADNDNSSSNELQTLSISGNSITLSNGGGTVSVPNDGDWTVSGNNQYSAVSGNVGIGTASPAQKLHVAGTTGRNMIIVQTSDNALDRGISFRNSGAAYTNSIYVKDAGNNQGDLVFSGGGSSGTITDLNDQMTIKGGTGSTAGYVGIGTSTPAQKLHVAGSIQMVDGNQQAGYIPVSDANGKMTWTSPSTITTAADGDGNSTNEIQTLSYTGSTLNLSNGGNSVDLSWTKSGNNIYNSNSGKVGIGTSSPITPLDVRGDASGGYLLLGKYVMRVVNNLTDATNGTQYNGLQILAGKENNNGANSRMISFMRPGDYYIGGIVQNNANSVAYNTTSDERLKTNIQPSTYGLTDLMDINVVDYVYKDEMDDPQNGFIAQQLYEVYPFPVIPGGEDVTQDPWTMDYGKLSPLLVKAVQDLKAEKDELEALVQVLMQRLEQLEQR